MQAGVEFSGGQLSLWPAQGCDLITLPQYYMFYFYMYFWLDVSSGFLCQQDTQKKEIKTTICTLIITNINVSEDFLLYNFIG